MAFARLTIDEKAIQQLVTGPGGPVAQQVNTITRRTANEARKLSPVDTGVLRSSVNEEVTMRGDKLIGRVYDDAPHAIYVHEGTRYMRARPFLYWALQRVSPWPVTRR